MDPKAYIKDYQERAKGDGALEVVYLAGPIDHDTGIDPDARHDLLETFLDKTILIYCPFCVQRGEKSAPVIAFKRNLGVLEQAESLVVVWDGPVETPSFGTPIELMAFASRDADRAVVVGSMGQGLVADTLRALGVREVGTMSEAIELLWPLL